MKRRPLAVLDTNVWIHVAAGTLHPAAILRAVGNAKFLVPATVLSELSSLVARRVISRRTLRRVRRAGDLVFLDEKTALDAGRIHGISQREGTGLSLADATILATARGMDAQLVTLDDDFEGERGVHIIPSDAIGA